MNYPTHLQYSKSHEWIHTEDGVAVIGISDFAQHALGDVVFVNLPGEGDEVTAAVYAASEPSLERCTLPPGLHCSSSNFCRNESLINSDS